MSEHSLYTVYIMLACSTGFFAGMDYLSVNRVEYGNPQDLLNPTINGAAT